MNWLCTNTSCPSQGALLDIHDINKHEECGYCCSDLEYIKKKNTLVELSNELNDNRERLERLLG